VMESGGIHVGDIGTVIIFDVGESLAAATVHKLLYLKPDGVSGEWEGTVDGTTLTFTTTAATDLDVAGRWMIQAYIDLGTWKGHSHMDPFVVWPNLAGG